MRHCSARASKPSLRRRTTCVLTPLGISRCEIECASASKMRRCDDATMRRCDARSPLWRSGGDTETIIYRVSRGVVFARVCARALQSIREPFVRGDDDRRRQPDVASFLKSRSETTNRRPRCQTTIGGRARPSVTEPKTDSDERGRLTFSQMRRGCRCDATPPIPPASALSLGGCRSRSVL
jgi:hypothetical protein